MQTEEGEAARPHGHHVTILEEQDGRPLVTVGGDFVPDEDHAFRTKISR